MKWIAALVALIALGVGAFFMLNAYIYEQKQAPSSHKDVTIILDGQPVVLKNGVSSVSADAGIPPIVTTYFGNEAKGDLNRDGIEDIGFIVTQNGGGSGTFVYAVAAIQDASGRYEGTHGVLLGDRIAPQTTEIRDGKLIVNYADRAPNEPMAVQPHIGKSLVLLLDPETMNWGEVAQDFEGEADLTKLYGKAWKWVSSQYNDGRTLTPKQDKFSITLTNDSRFTATTDCNSAFGSYAIKAGTIVFSDIGMTKMFCEGSQEQEFLTDLGNVAMFQYGPQGELLLDLKFDSGTMTFR